MCLENHKLFRLPWSFNDNPVAILELTDLCNLRCEGCYRSGIDGHKSLEQLKKEVILLKKARNIDSINLAGGEPLMHPQLIEIIEFIRGMGIKPSLITNGELLTKKKLLSLKKAGLVSIGIHIDSFQNRPGWEEKSEIELNTLRLYYAEMITRLLKIRPGFFLTIHLKNFQYTTEIVQWALDNIKYVGGITFFIFRAFLIDDNIEYYVNGKKVNLRENDVGHTTKKIEDLYLTLGDIYFLLKKCFADYGVQSYLGGTIVHDSIKLLAGNIIAGSNSRTFGSYGKKTVEIAQGLYHFFKKKYFSILKKDNLGKRIFFLVLFDKKLRKTLSKYLRFIISNPMGFFLPLYNLSIVIIQPPEMLDDGRFDMCENCPDISVYNGKLIPVCRIDEYRKYGNFLCAKILDKNKITGKIKEKRKTVLYL